MRTTGTSQVLEQIFEFLKVDTGFEPEQLGQRIDAAPAKPGLAQNKALAYTAKPMRRLGKAARASGDKGRAELPPMNPETRRWLVEEVYREPNEALAAWLGKDLSHWNRL